METLSLTKEVEPKVFASLGQRPLFRALKAEQLPQLLKVAELQRFDPGETIVRQGEPSDSFYIVIDGTAAVTVKKGEGDAVEIGQIPLPSSVGEVRYRTGITLSQDSLADETFRVVGLAPSSPGAQAGLSRGDVLLELDGRSAKEFTLEEVRQAIRLEGKRMLTVYRGGKRVKVVMELAGRIDTPAPPAGGPGAASRAARRN